MIPYTLTERSINLLVEGRMRTLEKSHANFQRVVNIVKLINSGQLSSLDMTAKLDALKEQVDIRAFIARVSEGRVQVSDTGVRFDGEEIRDSLVDRILQQLRDGFDVRPMARFLEKLKLNPNKDVADDMFKWLEHAGLPICEDGDFIAFKKVRDDYTSYRDKTMDHAIGTTPKMPRSECDENRLNRCSTGLHFCSYEYLPGYYGDTGRVVIVKINPANITSIPEEYQLSKGRCCEYAVIGEVPEDEAKDFFKDESVLSSFGTYDEDEDEDANRPVWNTTEWNVEKAKAFVDGHIGSLTEAFAWVKTPQGMDYWWRVTMRSGPHRDGAQVIVREWIKQYEEEETKRTQNGAMTGRHPHTNDTEASVEPLDWDDHEWDNAAATAYVNGDENAVSFAFVWGKTPQGYGYWASYGHNASADHTGPRAIVREWIKLYEEEQLKRTQPASEPVTDAELSSMVTMFGEKRAADKLGMSLKKLRRRLFRL